MQNCHLLMNEAGMARHATFQLTRTYTLVSIYRDPPALSQIHNQKGKLKATIKLKGFKSIWGRAVSQDGRCSHGLCTY